MQDCETASQPLTGPTSPHEERANTITHGIGFILSLLAGVGLIAFVAANGDLWRLLGCSVYAASLVAVYGASTLSHSFSEPRKKHLFRILDQACIYLLIVGTYTPFSLVYLRAGPWWVFLAVMWTIALFGFCSKIIFAHRIYGIAMWTYLALGWMPILASFWLIDMIPAPALWWMLYGGLCYTIGTAFLANDAKVSYFHAVWHLLVIAGSACHFYAILGFVANAR